MTAKKRTKPKIKPPADVRTSTINFSLNILIFLLASVVIYLSYSVFIKLTKEPVIDLTALNKSTPSDIIQVEVLNGCGVNGIADRFTDYLRDNNVDVVKIGNYVQFDIDETMVIDRIGNIANAKKIGELLGVKKSNVITQINNDYFVDVTIVIGRDYFKQTPITKE